jgi:hypothetical protein
MSSDSHLHLQHQLQQCRRFVDYQAFCFLKKKTAKDALLLPWCLCVWGIRQERARKMKKLDFPRFLMLFFCQS